MANAMLSPINLLHKAMRFTTICLVLISVLFYDVTYSTSDSKTIVLPRRDKRSTRNQQLPPNSAQLSDILQQYEIDHANSDLMRYTPTTPSPEDVNCYVEVPVTRRVGGRCVPLGRRSMGCQAGLFLAFSPECQNEAGAQGQGDGAQQGTSSAAFRRPNPFRRGNRLSQLNRRPRP